MVEEKTKVHGGESKSSTEKPAKQEEKPGGGIKRKHFLSIVGVVLIIFLGVVLVWRLGVPLEKPEAPPKPEHEPSEPTPAEPKPAGEVDRPVQKGDIVVVNYVGRLEDGTIFDTSYEDVAKKAGIYDERRRYEPIRFEVGSGQMIQGFDEAVVGMRPGEKKTVTIPPEKAYPYDPNLVQDVPRTQEINRVEELRLQGFREYFKVEPKVGNTFETGVGKAEIIAVGENTVTARLTLQRGDTVETPFGPAEVVDATEEKITLRINPKPGQWVMLPTPMGPRKVKVLEVSEEKVVLDMNHELAGKTLIFDISLEEIELKSEQPQQPVTQGISVDDDPALGDPNAPVVMVECSEYQCPYCRKYSLDTFKKIREEYINTGKVRYVFRDFPLGFHQYAQKAAEAAECADEQGRFWEYHDMLFENAPRLSLDDLRRYAEELGLDMEKFNACLDSGKYADEVQKDFQDCRAAGARGTPTFFINGEMVRGAQPIEKFREVIERKLAEKEGGTSS
ncbi:MAG: hypothetical protein DRO11_00865 [Methanobacteriota archaeon]|nr:MAG: hypothetical protein DRO11_00865 [Euryarchaeota archaeon]